MNSILTISALLSITASTPGSLPDLTPQVETQSTVQGWTEIITYFLQQRETTDAARIELAHAMVAVQSSMQAKTNPLEVEAFRRQLYLLCDVSYLRDEQLTVARTAISDADTCFTRCRWGNYALAVVQRIRRERINVETLPGVEFEIARDATVACRPILEQARTDQPEFSYAIVLAHIDALHHPAHADRVNALRALDDAILIASDRQGASDMTLDRRQILTDWATNAVACGDNAAALEALNRTQTLPARDTFATSTSGVVLTVLDQNSIPIRTRLSFLQAWLDGRKVGLDELFCMRDALVRIRRSGLDRATKLELATTVKHMIDAAPSSALDALDASLSTSLLDAGEEAQAAAVHYMPFRAEVAEAWFDSLREAGSDRASLQPLATQLLTDFPDHPRAQEFRGLLK